MSSAKIISFISTKGSVGKTSLTIHMAGYLASLGKKVLLIDADSQQSLSNFFDLTEQHHSTHNGFALFLIGQQVAEQVIRKTQNHPNIDIIINDDPEKMLTSHFLRQSSGAVFRLAFLLEPLKAQYDYIFIDTEGTDGRDHEGRSVQNTALLARPDIVLLATKPKMLFAMETARVVDVLKTARLLKTIVPVERKFFESFFMTKTFAHEYRDPNKHDHLNVVIQSLCEEIFPELVE